MRHFVLGVITLMMASCSTGNTPTPAPNTDFVVSGKGVQVLLEATFDPNAGDGNFYSTALSAQDDGIVSWTYGRGACCGIPPTLYRRKFDGKTGQVLTPDGDLTKITRTDLFTGGPDGFGAAIRYVQGTGKLYESTRNHVTGDVPDYTNNDTNTFTGPPLVYPDGDVVISSNPSPNSNGQFNYTSQMWVRRKHGVNDQFFQTLNQTGTNPDTFWHGGICFPSDANGGLSCLTSTTSQVLIVDVQGSSTVTPKIVGSAPFVGYRIENPINISPSFKIKTSVNHAKSVVLMRESVNYPDGYHYSTFIVDNATHQVKVVVANQVLTDLYRFQEEPDFDMDGNIYFFKWRSSLETSDHVSLIKQTATGPTVLKSEFLVSPTTPHALVVSATGSLYAVLASKTHFAVCALN